MVCVGCCHSPISGSGGHFIRCFLTSYPFSLSEYIHIYGANDITSLDCIRGKDLHIRVANPTLMIMDEAWKETSPHMWS